MFHGRVDDVGSCSRVDAATNRAPHCRRNGLSCSAREEHFALFGAEERGDLGSCILEERSCRHALVVNAPRVAESYCGLLREDVDGDDPSRFAQG